MKTDVYENETTSTATNRSHAGDKSDISKEEMMKKMEAAGTPGPAHKALGAFVGNWKAEVKCWMDPAGPPNVSQATSQAKWTLNGHFVEEEFHGEMMGKPFTGRCLFGFDNTKQKFNSVWVDDMHTSMFTSEGRGENGYKVIMLEGKMDCPGTDQKDIPMKQVFRVLSPDKHVLEMFNDGRKTMEITYIRG
jgi:hypothetical protein